MRITTVDAVSVNGKLTNGEDAHSHTWTSDEDWDHFRHLLNSHKAIVMGSRTYEIVQPEPEAERLRVVLTRHPEKYEGKNIPGQLEFWNEPPERVVELLEKRGIEHMLLVGGQVNTAFWAAGLVNEAYVTIEPLVFGKGRQLADGADFTATLRLQSAKQLNSRGTLLLHYKIEENQITS